MLSTLRPVPLLPHVTLRDHFTARDVRFQQSTVSGSNKVRRQVLTKYGVRFQQSTASGPNKARAEGAISYILPKLRDIRCGFAKEGS